MEKSDYYVYIHQNQEFIALNDYENNDAIFYSNEIEALEIIEETGKIFMGNGINARLELSLNSYTDSKNTHVYRYNYAMKVM